MHGVRQLLLVSIGLLLCIGMSALDLHAQTLNLDLSVRFAVAVDWQGNGYRLAITVPGDDHIYIYVNTLQEIARLDMGIKDADFLAWSPDGHQLAAAINGGPSGNFIQVWNANSDSTPFVLAQSLSSTAITDLLKWSPDGTVLGRRRNGVLAVVNGGNIEIRDVDSGAIITTFAVNNGGARDVAWKPDGTEIAAVSGLGVLRVWDVATGILVLEKQDNSIYWSVVWRPDGELLAVYNVQNQTFEFWDAPQQQILFTHPGSGHTVRDEELLVWGAGGFISFDRQNRIKFWNIGSGANTWTIQAGGRIEAVEWNPDGTQLFYATTTQGGLQDAVQIVPVPTGTNTPSSIVNPK